MRSLVVLSACVSHLWIAGAASAQSPDAAVGAELDARAEVGADRPGRAGGPETLGTYERQALADAMSELGLAPDPAPDGKRVGRILVVNMDVFSPRDGFLTAFNFFHRTTRESVIRREVLLRPGQMWQPDLIQETERKLRDPIFTTLVVMAPVVSQRPGHVDLLVVTRDVWSLRLNSAFELQDDTLTKLRLSLSENNFLGLRKTALLLFDMDQGSYEVGPLYLDKNVAGKRLQLRVQANAIFERATSELEGSSTSLVFQRPLWTLASRWGVGISMSRIDFVQRRFVGAELLPRDLEATPEDDMLPDVFRRRFAQVTAAVEHQRGREVKHQIEGGYRLESDQSEVLPDFPGDEVQRAAFEQEVMPRSERLSSVFASYRLFTPRFVKLRNIDGYELSEDLRLGPELRVTAAPSLELLGSDLDFVALSASAGFTQRWQGGFVRLSAAAGTRALLSGDGDRFVDRDVAAAVRVVTPVVSRARAFVRASLSARFRDTDNRDFFLGGENGLRAYPGNSFSGDRRVTANFEIRTQPLGILFTRAGLLAFYDVGHAADTFGALRFKHGVGAGMRALIPQLSTLVYRLDVAIPLVSADIPRLGRVDAGFGGLRVIAGVGQAF